MAEYDPRRGGPNSAAYHSYLQETAFRWCFLCLACYARLDNELGLAEVGGRVLRLAGTSRAGKAAVVDEAKYEAFQRRQAAALGIEH